MALYDRLHKRDEEGKPILVGSHGAGWMGEGFAAALRHVPGMTLAVLADADIAKARKTLTDLGGADPDGIVETEKTDDAEDALRSGKRLVTADPFLASKIPSVDVVTDVTPSPASGAAVADAAISDGKDVVLVNIEADVTVGAALAERARKAGTLYSVSSGDEPGCLMELWDFVRCLGYEPVVIGKGKNNPLDVTATPDDVAESARKSDKDPFQVASYVDGTKTMFELGCVANATGCIPSRPGMTGPVADLTTVSDLFRLAADGGTVPHPGVVDYVQGPAMSGGVFVTVRIEDPRIGDDLGYLKVGKGPYFTFFRPYHLWFLEAPISFAKAVLDREITLASLERPTADVTTVAKKDLVPGDRLDDFGGYTFRGWMMPAAEAAEQRALPAGLAPGAVVARPVQTGDIVTWEDVTLDENAPVVKLRRAQDAAR